MHARITVHLDAVASKVDGHIGDFTTTIASNGRTTQVEHGVLVLATGATEQKPTSYGYGQDARVLTQLELSDRLGRRGIIVAGWVYYAAVYAAFAFVESHLGLFLLFGAYGLFYALTEGAERALVADLAPAHRRATALGVYHFVVGAAALPASIICGSLWQWRVLGPLWGPRVALGFGSACALAASALFLVLKPGSSRRVEPQDEAQGR